VSKANVELVESSVRISGIRVNLVIATERYGSKIPKSEESAESV
jgi:hypothetical protein